MQYLLVSFISAALAEVGRSGTAGSGDLHRDLRVGQFVVRGLGAFG
jgi:hypothetical protein